MECYFVCISIMILKHKYCDNSQMGKVELDGYNNL